MFNLIPNHNLGDFTAALQQCVKAVVDEPNKIVPRSKPRAIFVMKLPALLGVDSIGLIYAPFDGRKRVW